MKQGYKIFSLIALIVLTHSASAQRWLQSPYIKSKPDSSGNYNFYDIQKAFQRYEKKYDRENKVDSDADKDEGAGENERKFEGYMEYKRWEWFNEQRVYPTGKFPSTEMILNEYQKFIDNSSTTGRNNNLETTSSNTWVNLSTPNMPVATWAGMGRVNCLTFLPGNNNTLFIGTACGGVWKSTNGGQTWAVLNTDQLPSLSITSICIDPTNTNNIYIATGDNFTGFLITGVLKQGHFSAGVFKSNDGGLTWMQAGMPSIQSQQFIPQQMIMDPVTPAIMLLASNTGIWKTIDNGTIWTLQQAGFFYSIEFNPLNHNVVFATDGQGLWRSNNNGTTWTYRGGGYPNTVGGRVTLAVTPADTNIVYTWGKITNNTTKFKKYTNAGNTFNGFINMTDPFSIASPYGYVDMAIGVSKTNVLNVMVGGLTSAKSLNGGTSWVQASDYLNYLLPNYFHGDIKKIIFEPGSGTKLYALNDAGIAVSTDNSVTWTNISNGLQITEIYKVASDPSNSDIIYYGAQDNGSNRWNDANDSIGLLAAGDGFQPLVDFNNPLILFTSAQVGNFNKSIDGGVNFISASPGITLWNPPFKFNPLNTQTMYVGCAAGYKKSTMGGAQLTYVNMTTNILTSIIALDVAKADTNYQYAASKDTMIKTINNGANWSYITPGLPVSLAAISYIACSPSNPNKVWVTFSGYSAGNKVFMSNDGGSTWINYSGTLPNIPINCLLYVEGTNDEVYIGTDFGVFYRDASAPDWTSFNTGLPNVIVNHLDIHYGTMKIRAGTYGRGLWETNLLITGTLPVELLDFTGHHNTIINANDLQWTTASEINCNYYELMKSNDAKYFSSIARVNGKGNSNQVRNYDFSDKENISDINYYYLNQVDFNGQSSQSNIILIHNGDDEKNITIFPNPVNDKIQFQFLRHKEIYDLELFDVIGKQIVMQPAMQISADENNTVDVSFLNSGVYMIKLTSNLKGDFLYGKFVKK